MRQQNLNPLGEVTNCHPEPSELRWGSEEWSDNIDVLLHEWSGTSECVKLGSRPIERGSIDLTLVTLLYIVLYLDMKYWPIVSFG